MATQNRSLQIKQVLKVLRRHHKGADPQPGLSTFEYLLFACCLENSPHEAAERACATLKKQYYDWNEVRVSSIGELAESLKMLNDPEDGARRVKRTLQSVFESFYSFDLDGLKKENIGQAVKKLDSFDGTTPFAVAYVTQAALGGHSIPVNDGLLGAFVVLGVVTEAEAPKGTVPGIERAIPKSNGIEAGYVLHYLGIAFGRNPYSPAVRKLLLEIDPTCKDRLPKRPTKSPPPVDPSVHPTKKTPEEKRSAKSPPAKSKKSSARPTDKEKKAATQKSSTQKSSTRKLSKRKPR